MNAFSQTESYWKESSHKQNEHRKKNLLQQNSNQIFFVSSKKKVHKKYFLFRIFKSWKFKFWKWMKPDHHQTINIEKNQNIIINLFQFFQFLDIYSFHCKVCNLKPNISLIHRGIIIRNCICLYYLQEGIFLWNDRANFNQDSAKSWFICSSCIIYRFFRRNLFIVEY